MEVLHAGTLIILLLMLQCLRLSLSHPLCLDLGAPFTSDISAKVCPYNGLTCCNASQNLQLQNEFKTMNVSTSACASVLQSILCARCDPFSAELFRVDSASLLLPVLCNSTVFSNSSQSSQAENDFCSNVWDACKNVSISNSPFTPKIQNQLGIQINSSFSKLADSWQSKTEFCRSFGGVSADGSVCFAGEPVKFNRNGKRNPPPGLCLEKIGTGSYLNMAPHPDGSNRAFFSNQPGKIWLATIPKVDSGGTIRIDEDDPFIDLTDQIYFSSQSGLMGIAFHPNFVKNGRFFASFNCDRTKWQGCNGRCACNLDVNCDPSNLSRGVGSEPCQYQSVVAEYTANGTASNVSTALAAKPLEVKRILTIGLPFLSHHGGQILFGPSDGYLYFMMGDGGDPNASYAFSQNKKSLLGKIIRLDVDSKPSTGEMDQFSLWGNYSIPKDNPFTEDDSLLPEIWVLGLRNPWRCSFDSERSSYFLCADVGQDVYEEVDVITKSGNYGWPIYEGPYPFNLSLSPNENTSIQSTSLIFPILGYNHSEINKNEGSAAIIGGYFVRSKADPCMYGRYLYGDLYASNMWAADEWPESSGNFTASNLPFKCAGDSPIPCTSIAGTSLPSLGYVYSFSEDNQKDVFILSSSGVYRVVRPSQCNYTCSMEVPRATVPTLHTDTPRPSPSAKLLPFPTMFLFIFSPLLFGLV